MKINLKNKLIKNSSYYLLFTTIEVIIPLIILPFITKILSTEDYGIYVLFSTIVPLSVSFFSLGINDSLVIQLYKLNNSRLASYFTSNLIFIFFAIASTCFWVSLIFLPNNLPWHLTQDFAFLTSLSLGKTIDPHTWHSHFLGVPLFTYGSRGFSFILRKKLSASA